MDASGQGSGAWLVEPANRLKVGGLFLLLPHILIPAGNSLVAVADGVIGGFVIGPLGLDPMTYYRNVPPILRWLVISSSQWLVLRGLVRSAGLWIGATVFAIVLVVVLQNALVAAGYASILMFPLGGLAVGGAQTWCLLQFTRREAARRAAPAA